MESKGILLDADILSHFMASGREDLLPSIFQGHILMLVDQVYQEASHVPGEPGRKAALDRWMNTHSVFRLAFPSDLSLDVVDEYFRLKAEHPCLGKGERACLSIARYYHDVIASSNFRDVAAYCNIHEIEYLGMLDILWIGIRNGSLTEAEADVIIDMAIQKDNARFPVRYIRDYLPGKKLNAWVQG